MMIGKGAPGQWLHAALDGASDKSNAGAAIRLGLVLLIVINIVAMILESVAWINQQHETWFRWIEVVSVGVFTAEYLARVSVCVNDPRFSRPIIGRLRYLATPMALVDLAAILPFYIATMGIDLRFVRVLRMARLLRLAKIARYSHAMNLLVRVFKSKRYELGITLMGSGMLLLIASVLMFSAEQAAQPEKFSSIPATMWWAVATLTTVGYGDMYPVTPLGQVLGSVVSIAGIVMFALPTAIVGAAFVNELSNETGDDDNVCERCGHVQPRRPDENP